ncbi:aminoglycoside phosphotransferase family protein [Alteribacter aurantiacus]|uniref:phosphotransferase family protein n=1 Tax=Alteribacter aurantiacus TaxID=254410 RepID=UPI00040623E5
MIGDRVAKGNTANIYLYDNKIYKVFHDFLPDTESEYEACKQRYAQSCGLPVPIVIDVTRVNGKQTIVMEYVKGETLGDLLVENMDEAENDLLKAIELQERIHQVDGGSVEPMFQKLSRQVDVAPCLTQIQKDTLIKRMESITYESKLCHGDFHLFNIIQSPQGLTLIDWVDASSGDPRADVCRTYLLYQSYSAELADMYLKLYCQRSQISVEEILQWLPILAAARLAEHVSSENPERLLRIVTDFISS